MARTELTKTVAPGSNNYTGQTLTTAAADVANGNQFTAQGNDLLIVRNSGGSPYTLTVVSSVDPFGRTQDIDAVSIAAGATMIFGPLKIIGWIQTDGKVYVNGSNASLLIGVITLPG